MTAIDTSAERTRWGMVALGFAAGVAGMFQTAKMSVALVEVQRDIGLDLVAASWTTTAVSLTGALFGVVAGRIVGVFGAARTLVAALLLGAIAGVATALIAAPGPFLAARIVEGLGYLLICTAAPTAMAAAAAPRDRGTALAIWGAFVPVSVSIMAMTGPAATAAWGWRTMFLISAASLVAVAAVVAAVAPRDPPVGRGIGRRLGEIAAAAPAVHLSLYRSARSLGLGVAFMAFAALQVGLIALLPTHLIEVGGLSPATAGLVLSATAPFAVLGTLLAGVMQRVGAADAPATAVAFAVMALSGGAAFAGLSDPWLLGPVGAVFFTAGGVVGSVIFASLPRRSTGGDVALMSGLIVQFGNVGSLTGAPILAATVETVGWGGVPWAVAAMAGVGIAGTLAAR
ncbi:MFS transporter [Oharaeibacter diazotrophicus]|uniref:Putative MFS family arabinose efflux permease n=2 Tax=Oharaeibacter diazotrophicus TaxID=1920512 RepID=A0A4R6RM16_9HYPH|nr:MFS transporter [Oharaeibacter diazotrophicus]TDP87594.1 putative MFS family arabinose efflux permease [Oharaeibacter diazotrophicus]BBE70462.1 major facilitator superfamily protein [Pleomorphomonas sp. SM30]GLS77206.1 MFS transporter [Oharaeibacter diazotrophicus]